jgi:hypothetical protein
MLAHRLARKGIGEPSLRLRPLLLQNPVMAKFKVERVGGHKDQEIEADSYEEEGSYVTFWDNISGGGRHRVASFKTDTVLSVSRLNEA